MLNHSHFHISRPDIKSRGTHFPYEPCTTLIFWTFLPGNWFLQAGHILTTQTLRFRSLLTFQMTNFVQTWSLGESFLVFAFIKMHRNDMRHMKRKTLVYVNIFFGPLKWLKTLLYDNIFLIKRPWCPIFENIVLEYCWYRICCISLSYKHGQINIVDIKGRHKQKI